MLGKTAGRETVDCHPWLQGSLRRSSVGSREMQFKCREMAFGCLFDPVGCLGVAGVGLWQGQGALVLCWKSERGGWSSPTTIGGTTATTAPHNESLDKKRLLEKGTHQQNTGNIPWPKGLFENSNPSKMNGI